ncbi:MAG: hypothetical protein WC325_10220 [Candidatus Bathyarchaeia archaeon]|jgi:hypothetical protein
MPRKQKTYSLPLPVAEWIRKFFEDNKEDLTLIGITSETRLLEVLARNGEQAVHDLLGDLKSRRQARQAQQKQPHA